MATDTGTLTVLLPESDRSLPLRPLAPAGVRYEYYDPDQRLSDEQAEAGALVVWSSPQWQVEDCARRMPHLRWVQTLAAGPDQALTAGFAPGVIITCGRGLHDLPVTEHTLALILAAARKLHVAFAAQREHHWAQELSWVAQVAGQQRGLSTLLGANAQLWGFGSIAQSLAPHLTALGVDVTGVAQQPGERAGYPVVTPSEADETLPATDLLVMTLPLTEQTRHLVGARRLALLPRHAWVVNVGRGPVLDEEALIAALRAGAIGGAALDVFETEPLPASSPLWDMPNVIITPHGAGGRPLGADERIARNAAALLAGEPMIAEVSR